jgi:hypothetical protein
MDWNAAEEAQAGRGEGTSCSSDGAYGGGDALGGGVAVMMDCVLMARMAVYFDVRSWWHGWRCSLASAAMMRAVVVAVVVMVECAETSRMADGAGLACAARASVVAVVVRGSAAVPPRPRLVRQLGGRR